jgi:hypothetical protein
MRNSDDSARRKEAKSVFTFDLPRARSNQSAPAAPVALLRISENEHARYVIEQKQKRPDFKALQTHWGKSRP